MKIYQVSINVIITGHFTYGEYWKLYQHHISYGELYSENFYHHYALQMDIV